MTASRMLALVLLTVAVGGGCRGERVNPATGGAVSVDAPAGGLDGCPAGLVEVPGRTDAPGLDRFCIGDSEVTVGQYRKCVDAGSCTPPDDLESPQSTWRSGEDDLPLNFADFEEAIAYCEFVGGRLPTLEEWVWAFRSGRDWALPWGDEIAPGTRVCQMPVPTVAPPRCPAKSHPIDRTAQGAYDMAGSLNELVRAPHEFLPGRSVFVPPPSRSPDGLTVVKDIRATYAPRSSPKNPDGGGAYDGFRCAATPRAHATMAQ